MTTTTSVRPRRRIVVGVDGSPESESALQWAARIADVEDATIDIVGAWQYPQAYGWIAIPEGYSPQADIEKSTVRSVDRVFDGNRPAGLTVQIVEGNPARALLEFGKDALMIVVGSRGHGGFAGLLLGSVSQAVAEHATVPVLVVHDGERPSP